MAIIEIKWIGAYNPTTISSLRSSEDFGVYQIYGNHNISGPKTLLYIGQANDQFFGVRIPQHEWVSLEQLDCEIYVGKLGSSEQCSPATWTKQVNIVEKLLVDYCQPPFNSQLLQGLDNLIDDETLLFNFGKRFKLPFEVSTMWRNSTFNQSIWKPYSNKNFDII
jgi:hypothetical protein